jgi:DNA repair protein RadC
MNRANYVLDYEQISSGGMTGTVADPKIIFNKALHKNACSLIVAHNHPSGNLRPSKADLDLTKKLKHAGSLLDLPVLDHLIITTSGYYSFADEGVL